MQHTKCIQCKTEDLKKGSRRFCSNKCYANSMRGIPTGIFWSTASEEQKLLRIKKFYEKKVIRLENECWKWQGCLGTGNYGFISVNNKSTPASRISWIIHKGPIPEGLFVLHKCDNPPCTNPEHLFLGTTKDNAQDRSKKGRNRNQNGENNSKALLKQEDVREIRKLIQDGVCYTLISERFNIAKPTISNIKYGKTWKATL